MLRLFKKKLPIIFLILIILIYSKEINAFKILFKLPTKSRPHKALKLIESLKTHLSNQIDYEILLTCDIDDKTMNNKKIKRLIDKLSNVKYIFSSSSSKIHACNRDLDLIKFDFDVLVLLSDDMVPICHNLDLEIRDKFLKNFPNFDGIVNFNDGVVGEKLCTLPILGKKYLEKFGYIYHPGYISVFCDLELRLVSHTINKYSYNDKILFRHDHASITKDFDELAKKNASMKFYLKDRNFFLTRLCKNFDLDGLYYYSSKSIFGLTDCIFEKSLVFYGDIKNNESISKIIKLVNFIQSEGLYKNIELIFTNKNIDDVKFLVNGKIMQCADLDKFDENNIKAFLL